MHKFIFKNVYFYILYVNKFSSRPAVSNGSGTDNKGIMGLNLRKLYALGNLKITKLI